MDLIRNNFTQYYSPYISTSELYLKQTNREFVKQSVLELERGPKLIKSHALPDFRRFFRGAPKIGMCLEGHLRQSKVIYVYRDGRDVLTSLFFYYKHLGRLATLQNFSGFLRERNDYCLHEYEGDLNRVEYWAYHVRQWMQMTAALRVSYETLIENYRESVARFADFLHTPISNPIMDVRRCADTAERRTRPPKEEPVKWTSVAFRAGRIGDHRLMFSAADYEIYERVAGDILTSHLLAPSLSMTCAVMNK